MGSGSLLLAVTAGMLAACNPCGFAMLPAYLSVLVAENDVAENDVAGNDGDGGGRGRLGAAGRALTSTAAMTAGFVAVFAALGFALAPAAGWIQPRLPWVTVTLGIVLVLVGAWLAAGRRLPGLTTVARAPRLTRSVPSMALFGVAYALASVSCTIAPFLAIVVASLRGGSAWATVGLFLAYALGMALVVGVTALAVALVRTSLLNRVRRASALVPRAGGVLLALAGAYVAYYGSYELRVAANARWAGADPIVAAATTVQQSLVSGLRWIGIGPLVAVFVVLLIAGVALGHLRTRVGRPAAHPESRETAASLLR